MMKRTQIYLPPHLHRRLKEEAKRRKCSLAKLLRESIEKDYGIFPKKGAAGLLEMIEHAKDLERKHPTPKDAPTDLSEKIDHYLYGEGRIE